MFLDSWGESLLPMSLPDRAGSLHLGVGYPRTFAVPTAWMEWSWILRLMSLHVRLGRLVS